MTSPRRSDPSAPADARDTAAGSRTAPVGGPPPAEPQPGAMIGPYRVLRELGRGGMAVVYEADDTELARRVALKILVGPAADEQGKRRFVREAQAQAKVTHEHVVPIYRVGEDRGVSYIAMPILNGQTLAQALTAVPRPPLASVVRIGLEIAEGLAAAHAVGLIHRDIKPSNVWLEAPRWRVRILDFGLARPPHAESGGDITIQGQIVGTPAYMSPEQARGTPVDHRTDLWSLGVVLYQMAVGDKPFDGANTLSLMTSIVSVEPPPPAALVPEVPPALSDLILRLLAKNPADRPATADEVAATLAALGGAPAAPSGWHPVAPADPWSEIDSAEIVSRPMRRAEPSRRDEYEDDEDEDEQPRRSRKWLWAIPAVAAFALLGGLVAMAVNAVSPKPKPTEPSAERPKEPPKPPVPVPVPKPPESDRAAIEALSASAKLKVQAEGRAAVEVAPGGALPVGKLSLLQIDFEDNDALGPHFVTNTFLPALANLRSLTDVRMKRWQMTLAPEHLRQMAAMPLAATLLRLDAQVELTPAALADLRKFTVLNDLTLNVPKPDDALFARIAELKKVETLTFIELAPAPGLTNKGWESIAGMSLGWLTIVRSPAAPAALRGLTARRGPVPPLEFLTCPELTDDDLSELSEKPTDVRALTFRTVPITDAGLKHLEAVKSLRAVSLERTRVTAAGARALAAARPDVKVVHNDVTIGKN